MVYLISPYKIRRDVHDDHLYKKSKRHGWFKITKYNDKNSSTIENFFRKFGWRGYPKLTIITYDSGNGALGRVFKNNYIKKV